MTEDPIIKFLEGSEKDLQGRFIKDIWNYSDNEIESIHDFIQVLFPLDEQSKNSSSRFFIQDQALIPAIQSSEFAQANFKQSYKWFLGFLGRNSKWQKGYDHNQLRITRIIKSLNLLSSYENALAFYQSMVKLIKDDHSISQTTYDYWVGALKPNA
jgi:hypothetical protein